ncbi:MAG TPA: DMT family transporter [Acidiferrobacterales bacterium]
MTANPTTRWLPVACVLAGASMWGVVWYPMRLLDQGGLAGLWLTLVIYASALAFSLPRTWRGVAEWRASPRLMLLLMAAAGWTNIAFVEAVLNGNILRVLLLFYLSPLWAVLMARLVLHERISRLAFASLAIAMSGALVMLWNPALGAPWPRSGADWYALSAGFAFALSNVIVRKAQNVSVSAKSLAVWFGVTVLAAVLIGVWGLPAPRAGGDIFLGAVALGLFGILVMTVLVQYGVTHMPVHRSAVLALVELVAGAASQQLLTEEIVTAREWFGGALIVTGAYLVARATVGPKG